MRVCAALQDLSDADLNVMKVFIGRGSPLSDATPEETAALERYAAASDAVAVRITGRPLSGVLIGLNQFFQGEFKTSRTQGLNLNVE